MTWQAGSLLVLMLALAGGFGWYERTRADARVVALVATLAALATVGRIAFAAIPNVKPTTDIVLVSGYALGGGPGFAVGAVTGLVSNFFFGQGPWTPWQMAAWGVTGMTGAGLALITRNRIGRLPLAVVCTVIGFAFTVVQDVGDWVTYSDHSAAQLLTYVGTGLGFDVIDAVGCLLFALAFGPALLRSIQRFSRRLQVTWSPPSGIASMLVALALGTAIAVGLGGARATAAPSPTSYLLGAQNADGGFGAAAGQPSAGLYAGWAALGLAAEGIDPANVTKGGGTSLLAYVAAGAGGSLSDPGSLERTIIVARAAGEAVRSFGGHDLLAALESDVRRDGSVSEQVNWTTFAVLALRAAGVSPAPRTLAWLERQQNRDGGFSFAMAGAASDVDDTGAALEALAGTDASSVRRRAVAFIRRAQNHDGGFPSSPGGESNAQSTAWAIQGLIAAGVDPASLHDHGSASPLAYLRSLITSNGSIDYARGVVQAPVWVTGEALMALAGKPLPLAPVSGSPPRHHVARSSGRRAAAPTSAHGAHRRAATSRRTRAGARRAHRPRLAPAAPDRASSLRLVSRVFTVVCALALVGL